MQVKVRIIKSMWPQFQVMWVAGQVKWVDEKQADVLVEAGVAEILERPEPVFKPKLSKR